MNYKYYITIELAYLKELILAKQMHQKSAIFVTIWIFQIRNLRFNLIYAKGITIY